MDIALAIDRISETGLATYPVELSRALLRRGHRVRIVTSPVPINELPYVGRVFPRASAIRSSGWLPGELRRVHPEVVHVVSHDLLVRPLDRPSVWTAWHSPHGLLERWEEFRRSGFHGARYLGWHLLQAWRNYSLDVAAIRNCDAVIAPTRALQKDLRARGYRPIFLPPLLSLDPAAQPKTLAGVPRIISTTGDFRAPRKGFDLLTSALTRLRDRTAFETDHLYRFSKGTEGMEQAREALRRATVLAMPSRMEEFGYVALEALAVGTPVVAFDVPALNEIVDANSGVLVPPFNTERYADALEDVVTDPERYYSLSEGAIRRSRAFSADALIPRYESLYRSLQ